MTQATPGVVDSPPQTPDAAVDDEAPASSLRDYLPDVCLEWTPRYREWVLLAAILVAGALLRFTGVNWDGGHHLHPDERFLTMVEGAIRPGIAVPGPGGSGTQVQPASITAIYFDTARSALNPHNVGYGFFVYGTFPLFVVRWIAEITHHTGYDKIHVLGRVLSAISDLITVALVYVIGRRLYGARVGLLAAALSAFCVMQIQQAHFFVFDSFLLTLVVSCFFYCVDIAETGRWRSFFFAGIFLGLALATKLSIVVFAPIIALAGLIYVWRTEVNQEATGFRSLTTVWSSGALSRVVTAGVMSAFVAFVVFRIFQPYAFAGPGFFDLRLNPRWLDNIAYQAKSQDGTVDLPPSIQWAGTEPLLFPWRHMVAWGMGIPLGLTVWTGFAAAAAVVLWRGRWQHLLVISWSALCFVYFASVLNKTMRYLLPAYPFLILLGAWGLIALYEWTRWQKQQRTAAVHEGPRSLNPADSEPDEGRTTTGKNDSRHDGQFALRRSSFAASRLRPLVARWGTPAALALAAFVVIASAAWSFAFTRVYTRPVTRHAASLWYYQNVPKGSVLANEHWDDPLPVPIPNYDPSHYRGPQLPLYDPDEPKKLETLVQMLSQADYINLTSNRLYGSIPRIPQRYPMTTEYYRRLFAGELGFKLVKTFTSYPTLGPWEINDDRAEEAFTVYDHPKVLIFQKQPDFSAEKVRQILLGALEENPPIHVTPAQVGRPNLLLPADLRDEYVSGGTWSESFRLEGWQNTLAPLTWWLALQALGLLAAPLVWRLFAHVPDRGYGVSKALGLLAVSWLAWSLAGFRLLPWTRLTLLIAFAA
ncbi:MAG: glycosyltransferase family 39 protein, partial [Chloroflexi bacterium]|nr:glycosyltransferase family 39 protein [Chloroflexota bacterium]